MNIDQFIDSVENFGALTPTQRILAIAWFLTRHKSQESFTTQDIVKLFDAAGFERPSSTSAFLSNLTKKKPPKVLKKGGKFSLHRDIVRALDAEYGRRESTIHLDAMLSELSAKIGVTVERVYLEETLTCFRHGAFRATVVMAWNLAFDHLCEFILKNELGRFNVQLAKSFPKSKPAQIASRDDLTSLKESEVLQVAKSASIVTSSVHKVLKEKLDRRNVAAHPSGVSISQLTAEEYLVDVVENVVTKIKV